MTENRYTQTHTHQFTFNDFGFKFMQMKPEKFIIRHSLHLTFSSLSVFFPINIFLSIQKKIIGNFKLVRLHEIQRYCMINELLAQVS